MTTTQTAFSNQLEKLRQASGLSQETLAEHSGLSRNYIGLLECGHRAPSLGTVLKLMRALEIKDANVMIRGSKGSSHLPTKTKPSSQVKAHKSFQSLIRNLDDKQINQVLKIVRSALRLRE